MPFEYTLRALQNTVMTISSYDNARIEEREDTYERVHNDVLLARARLTRSRLPASPRVSVGQGGLLEVLPHPRFAEHQLHSLPTRIPPAHCRVPAPLPRRNQVRPRRSKRRR